jgi:hypothetical protein
VSDFVLTPAEHALLVALDELGVRYLIVGMAAALFEGAPGTTQDLDLWLGSFDPERVARAARRAGGFYTSGSGLQPRTIGGRDLERIDLVPTGEGLEPFDTEYANAREREIDGLEVRVLPLARVIASKRAANRAKDVAQLPLLNATLAAREGGRRRE